MKQDATKNKVAYSLCGPGCGPSCPVVEVDENGAKIGEHNNWVSLKPEQWKMLVQAIREGKLQ